MKPVKGMHGTAMDKEFNTTKEHGLHIKGGVLNGAEWRYSMKFCTLKASHL